jgi:glycosyltransferase involved in cell wall biosynthesis
MQKPNMKVAFITHYTALYGANRSLLNLIDGLIPHGVQPFVIVPCEGDLTLALQERGIAFLVAPYQWWSSIVAPAEGLCGKITRYVEWRRSALRRLRTNILILPRVVRLLKEWNIDICYTNSSVIPMGALVAWWLRKPHVWHLREFGDLDYRLTFDWGKAINNFFLRRADAQICISEAIRSHYTSGLVKDKCHVVYNGVATEEEMDKFHQAAAARTTSNGKFVFALVGLIHPAKGQETAIKALGLLKESFPEVRLIIAGGGDTKPLAELAASCGVSEQTTIWGYAQNPYVVYQQSDAVLMCSKNEAMGRVTVEAMSAAKPVIGYSGGCTPELIEHEFNGLLYKGEERELAACMRRLMENPASARVMGGNGWRIARGKFTVETYAEKIHKVLAALHEHRGKTDGTYTVDSDGVSVPTVKGRKR